MAYSVTVLTWGLIKYQDAYIDAGELKNMLDCIRWPLNYFMKAHPSKYEFYAQVRRYFAQEHKISLILSSILVLVSQKAR